ncbi:MAG TPA: PKD domain-containing protein [Solirubrobacteraceae bacterium]|nr:PKD domain-containing protein [Solirubrobacteraceae bacterium]
MGSVVKTLVRDHWDRISSNGRRLAQVIAGAFAFALALALTGAPVAGADAGDPLSYYGGPVVHATTGVVVAWGTGVNPIYTDPTSGDPGLIKYFAASSGSTGDTGGVLAQYMDQQGNAAPDVTYGEQYQITPSIDSSTIDDDQIQSELASQIENGALPAPTGQDGLGSVYILLFGPGDTECMDSAGTECSGTYFCAYHGDARLPDGTAALYAVIPDTASGAEDQDCGPSSSALANQTSLLSHEWSEAITDPLVGEATSGDAPPLAWYDDNCSSVEPVCGEIGDKCNQMQGLNGDWTVQLEWSNLDSACELTEPSYSAPTAAFTANSSTYVGQALGFDASGSSDPSIDQTWVNYDGTPYSISPGISSYAWDWGDGTGTDSGQTVSHTFAAPGLYQVSMTVADDLGFTSTITQPIVVWSDSPPVAPDVTTTPASAVDDQSATLNGSVDPQGQPVIYSFAYGTSPDDLGQETAATDLAPETGPEPVSTPLSGLSPSTTYYYELDAEVAGQIYPASNVESFTTAPAPQDQSGGGGSSGGGTPPPPTTGAQNPPAPTPAAPKLPSAATGGVSALTSASATVAGAVDPDGLATSYLVEFGKTSSYGHSSASLSAGAGQSSVAVSAMLTGLRPRTVYHYRLVAVNAAGTAVGADRTFKTRAAPPRPPRFSFVAPSRITLAQALAGNLRVAFHCSAACTARFAVTIALPGIERLQAIPVTLARGSGRTHGAGSEQVTLRFTRVIRHALRNARSLRLEISGYAVRGESAPSAVRVARLTVVR